MKDDWILTRSGKQFFFLDPKPSQICIEDIAHALSRIPRFNAHTVKPYSVASHCIYISEVLPRGLKLQGLMHEAAEAYLGDMTSPLKAMIPGFKEIERGIEKVIFSKFNITYPLSPKVKEADIRMLATEKRDVMPQTSHVWKCLEGVDPYPFTIPQDENTSVDRVMVTFLELFYQYMRTGE